MDWQLIPVTLVIVGAISYLCREVWQSWRGQKVGLCRPMSVCQQGQHHLDRSRPAHFTSKLTQSPEIGYLSHLASKTLLGTELQHSEIPQGKAETGPYWVAYRACYAFFHFFYLTSLAG